MANAIYPKAKEQMLQGGLDMSSGTVKMALIDLGTYTYNVSHEFFDDISGVVGTPVEITPKTFTNGIFDSSSDVVFSSVTGDTVEALVIYIDTGNPATSRLIAFLDTNQSGLPVTPNGGDITFSPNASGIFQL
jgi:hypothetical protein